MLPLLYAVFEFKTSNILVKVVTVGTLFSTYYNLRYKRDDKVLGIKTVTQIKLSNQYIKNINAFLEKKYKIHSHYLCHLTRQGVSWHSCYG